MSINEAIDLIPSSFPTPMPNVLFINGILEPPEGPARAGRAQGGGSLRSRARQGRWRACFENFARTDWPRRSAPSSQRTRGPGLFAGRSRIDAASLEELEEAPYTADFGVETTGGDSWPGRDPARPIRRDKELQRGARRRRSGATVPARRGCWRGARGGWRVERVVPNAFSAEGRRPCAMGTTPYLPTVIIG